MVVECGLSSGIRPMTACFLGVLCVLLFELLHPGMWCCLDERRRMRASSAGRFNVRLQKVLVSGREGTKVGSCSSGSSAPARRSSLPRDARRGVITVWR